MTPTRITRRSRQEHLAWTTVAQAAWLIARGATFGTAIRICVIVGTLLTVVNQGGVLASGQHGPVVLLRVLANYLIPYTVASIGYLAPFRVPASIGAADTDEHDE